MPASIEHDPNFPEEALDMNVRFRQTPPMHPTDTPWNPAAFRAAMTYHRMTQAALVEALAEQGHTYTVRSVRAWSQEGSAGPRLPVTKQAIIDLLPILSR